MIDIPAVNHVADGVYIGGAQAAACASPLRKAAITRVLKLYYGDPYWPPDFRVCENPFPDGEPISRRQLDYGVSFVQEQVLAGRKVLVCCGAGISRSATVVLGYLLTSGRQLPDAWYLLKRRHPDASPAFPLWESLFAAYDLPYSIRDVVEWYQADVRSTD